MQLHATVAYGQKLCMAVIFMGESNDKSVKNVCVSNSLLHPQ